MQRRNLVWAIAAFAVGGFALTGCSTSGEPDMARRQSIDTEVDQTLNKLYTTVPGSRELAGKAKGVLVFPSVVEAGLIVGGQHGDGALRVGGSTVGYYSTSAASFGLLAGAQSKALIFMFMTQDALDQFRNSEKEWTAGAGASVAVMKTGANAAIDTATTNAPVEAIVMTNSGIMGDLSVQGTKVSRLKI
jgi:lipid-binding SYLF domain-containing protein